MLEENKNLQTVLTEFNHQKISHYDLAKHVGFTDKEMNMLKIFWEPAFNKSWFYLYPEFITDELGYKSVGNFYSKVLFEKYIENIDYQKIDRNDELVKKSYMEKNPHRKIPGNKASFYKITGKTLKLVLMRARTSVALETHEYYIKIEELCMLMKDYVQELSVHKLQIQSDEHAKQIEKEKKRNLVLTEFVTNIKAKEKTQIFYIVTTKQYTMRNRYKFGGCRSRDLLKSNLAVYNRGKAEGDKHYYVFIRECYDFKAIEVLIKSAIPVTFKDAQNARNELIHCHYSIFARIVEMAIDNADSFTDKISGFIKDMIELTAHGEPSDPPAIEINKKAMLTITENGEEKLHVFDMDTMSDEEILTGIKESLGLYAADNGTQYSYDIDKDNKELNVIWKDFQKYLIQHFHIPKYGFKALQWRKKITPLKNNAKELDVKWVRTKHRLERRKKYK